MLAGMKITDGLLGEHALFYQLFDALEDALDAATRPEDIQHAFEPVAAGVLSHATVENDVLFTALGNGEGGIATAMRAEHREIENLAQAVARARTLDEAKTSGRHLIDLLREHFHREEQVLFPLCEHALDASRLETLGERYMAQRGLR